MKQNCRHMFQQQGAMPPKSSITPLPFWYGCHTPAQLEQSAAEKRARPNAPVFTSFSGCLCLK